MQGFTWFVITFAILAVLVVPAAYARKRYFADKKPQIGVAVVVGAAVLATIISVAILRSLAHDSGKRIDNVFAAMCKNPAAGDDAAKAFHDLSCSSDVRVADLRGANEYQ